MRRNEYVPLAVASVVMAVVLGLLSKFGFIDFAQGLQILITFILVCVTAIYVMRTADIADATRRQAEATRQQAEASVKMAEAMTRPSLFPDFTDATFPTPGKIWFVNLGTGSALRLEIKIAYSAPDVVKRAWVERTGQYGSLAGVHDANWSIVKPDDRVSCRPELAECHPGNVGTAFAEYSDIYGRRILSGWGYRCEKDSEGNPTLQPTEPIYPLVRERGEQK